MKAEMKKLSSPGERLEYIREIVLELPRAVMAKRHKLKIDTLYNWESGRVQITDKVLEQYLLNLKKEGVLVEKDWILEGIGKQPRKLSPLAEIEKVQAPTRITSIIPEKLLMPKEVSSFLAHHADAICVHVDSDVMLPFYAKGDYVCGDLVSEYDEVEQLVGYDCIVFLTGERYVVRRIQSVNKKDQTFNLVGTNPLSHEDEEKGVLSSVEILSAGEILLHRKQKSSLKNRL